MLNPPVNGKIEELFKAFECFSSTFQGKFYFQGLFKTVGTLFVYLLYAEFMQESCQNRVAKHEFSFREPVQPLDS